MRAPGSVIVVSLGFDTFAPRSARRLRPHDGGLPRGGTPGRCDRPATGDPPGRRLPPADARRERACLAARRRGPPDRLGRRTIRPMATHTGAAQPRPARSSTRSRPRSARTRSVRVAIEGDRPRSPRWTGHGRRRGRRPRDPGRDRRGPDRQGLVGTPERVHRMYTELTAGYHVDPERLINGAIFDVDYSEMVVVKDIPFYSLCEHHLLPFFGTAAVAYIPRGRVIGLSKIPRVVETYARRLQVQERLTQQIADFLQDAARAAGRRRRHGGDPPVRGDARRPQARHDHDHERRPRPVPLARQDARGVLRAPRTAVAGRLMPADSGAPASGRPSSPRRAAAATSPCRTQHGMRSAPAVGPRSPARSTGCAIVGQVMPYAFPDVGKVVLLGITKATRAAIGKDIGDKVEVELVRDDASRSATFEMPAELAGRPSRRTRQRKPPSTGWRRRTAVSTPSTWPTPSRPRPGSGVPRVRSTNFAARPERRRPGTRRQGRARHGRRRRCQAPPSRKRSQPKARPSPCITARRRARGGRRHRHPRRRWTGDCGPGRPGSPRLDRRCRRDGRARARARRRAGHGHVRLPQRPADRDIRRGLGDRRRRHARGNVPRVPGGDPVDAGGRVRSDRQHRRAFGLVGVARSSHYAAAKAGIVGLHQVACRRSAGPTASSSTRSRPC